MLGPLFTAWRGDSKPCIICGDPGDIYHSDDDPADRSKRRSWWECRSCHELPYKIEKEMRDGAS